MDTVAMMRAFVAVAEEGSFVAAARRLGTTPQLVSKYVQMLEADLEVTLLNRTTRQVNRTEVGQQYFERCLPILEDIDEMRESTRKAHAEPQGHLRLTAPVTFAELYLAEVLTEFTAAYPEITVNLHLTDKWVDLLAENIDVAIRIGTLNDSSFVAKRIMTTSRMACASPAYLEKRGIPTSYADLVDHEFIIDSNTRQKDEWETPKIDGIKTPVISGRVTVNSAAVAIEMAKLGAGIVTPPCIFVQKDIQEGTLTPLDWGQHNKSVGVFALFHKSERPSAKVRVFVDFLADRLGKAAGGQATKTRKSGL